MVYAFFRWLFATALTIFYRWQPSQGAIPPSGPLVIVGNHPNGLIDPAAVMRLTTRPIRFLAKAPIFKMPVLGWLVRAMQCLPVYRKQDDPSQMGKNDETFKAAHAALAQGSAICIFPEGKSHSEPALEPLKTGAARIALGAESEKGFGLGVRFVPVGFVYREKGVFRSEVAVAIGEPIGVEDLKAAHAEDPVKASQLLTDRLDAALRKVTVNLTTWEDLPLVEAAQRLYRAEKGQGADLRPFAEGLAALRAQDPQRLEQVRRRVVGFDQTLAELRIPLDDIDGVHPLRAVRFTLVQLLRLLLVGPFALAGFLAYVIPYQLIRAISRAKDWEEDMQGTVKLLSGLVFIPAWAAGLTWLGHHLAGWPGAAVLGAGLAVCALVALWFIERTREAWRDARAYLLLRGHGTLRERLKARRTSLVEELDQLGREVGVLPAA